MVNEAKNKYLKAHQKSRIASFFLTLFFGPLGFCYASPALGIVFIIVALFAMFTPFGLLVLWVAAVCIGDHVCYRHNQRAIANYEVMSSLQNFDRNA